MQAIICAAGRGNRIAHLTDGYPKALLPVGNKTVIEHILSSLSENGIEEVIVVVGHKAGTLKDFINKNSHGCSVSFIENEDFENTDNLYSMYLAREHIKGEMLFLNGDTVFHTDILKNFLASKLENTIIVDKANNPINPVSVHIKNGRLFEIEHDIKNESHGNSFGMYKLSRSASSKYFSITEEMFADGPARGGFFIPLQSMSSSFKIEPFFSNDSRWININTENDYQKAQNIFVDK